MTTRALFCDPTIFVYVNIMTPDLQSKIFVGINSTRKEDFVRVKASLSRDEYI